MEENNNIIGKVSNTNSTAQIAGAIVLAGCIIAGAIMVKGGSPTPTTGTPGVKIVDEAKITKQVPVFSTCLDSDKYAQAVADQTALGGKAGVQGTPKGFILKDGKVVATIDGAEPATATTPKIEKALLATTKGVANVNLPPVSSTDFILGDINSKVTIILYADFQCPFCGRFFKDSEQTVIDSYIKQGKINFVYRDYAFLGTESTKSAEAARCAGDQGKYWEYHDYLFTHQNGENQGNFSNANLKSFAKELKLK